MLFLTKVEKKLITLALKEKRKMKITNYYIKEYIYNYYYQIFHTSIC